MGALVETGAEFVNYFVNTVRSAGTIILTASDRPDVRFEGDLHPTCRVVLGAPPGRWSTRP
jgi:hypothetical protein